MIKCKKCKKITQRQEPTGLIKEYRIWIDKDGTKHKDISKIKRVCLGCLQNLKKEKSDGLD